MNAHVAEMMATERLLGLRRVSRAGPAARREAQRSRAVGSPGPAGSVRTSLATGSAARLSPASVRWPHGRGERERLDHRDHGRPPCQSDHRRPRARTGYHDGGARRGADREGRPPARAGEAGVGKSRLVEEAIRAATERGMEVLRGSCVNIGASGVPYGPIVEALRDLPRDLRRTRWRPWSATPGRTSPACCRRLVSPETSPS